MTVLFSMVKVIAFSLLSDLYAGSYGKYSPRSSPTQTEYFNNNIYSSFGESTARHCRYISKPSHVDTYRTIYKNTMFTATL